MKRSSLILVLLFVIAAIMVTSAGIVRYIAENGIPGSAEQTTTQEAESTTVEITTKKTEATTVPATTEASSETTTKQETTTVSSSKTSVTSKGFEIKEINGLTYIDGVLVVNKTYSIPSSYAPGGLTKECNSAFEAMASAAAQDNCNLYISSGYRSYNTQSNLYKRYAASDGTEKADTYSARPGHSEHQTGLAIDLNTITYSFADTAEGKWVDEHCWEYGFILRYPKGKTSVTGYNYEPWHVRYVGKDLAKAVYDSGLCLEEYFGITSQY